MATFSSGQRMKQFCQNWSADFISSSRWTPRVELTGFSFSTSLNCAGFVAFWKSRTWERYHDLFSEWDDLCRKLTYVFGFLVALWLCGFGHRGTAEDTRTLRSSSLCPETVQSRALDLSAEENLNVSLRSSCMDMKVYRMENGGSRPWLRQSLNSCRAFFRMLLSEVTWVVKGRSLPLVVSL